jgi:WD40 repeat protein
MKYVVGIFSLVWMFLVLPLETGAQGEDQTITSANAAQVTQVAILERGWINQIAWSADGSVLAIAAPSGVWLTDFVSDIRAVPVDSEALSLAYSADGSLLAVGTTDGTVQIMGGTTGEALHTIQCTDTWVDDIAVNSDGTQIVCSSQWGSYTVLRRVADGTEIHTWGKSSGSVAFPSSNLVGIGTQLINVETGEPVASIETDNSFGDTAFSSQGSHMAAVNSHGDVEVLDVETQQQRLLLETPGSLVQQHLAFSPNGQQLAVNVFNDVWGSALLLIDVTTGDVERILEIPDGTVHTMAYSPDGSSGAVATTAGHVLVWTVSDGMLRYEVSGFNQGGEWRGGASSDVSGATCLSFSSTGLLAIGTGGYVTTHGATHVWNPATLEQVQSISGEGTVWGMAYSPDNSILAVSNSFNGLRLLDVITGDTLFTLDTPGDVLDVAFSPDGMVLAVIYSDGSAQVWDVTTGEPRLSHANTSETVGMEAIAFSPLGDLVAFHNMLWNISTGEIQVLDANQITDLAFSSDGEFLAVATVDGIYLWDTMSGDLRTTFPGEDSVAFSPNGMLLASGLDGGDIALWDLKTEVQVGVLQGHVSSVNGLAFNPDGTLLASTSFDGTSRLWGVVEGN